MPGSTDEDRLDKARVLATSQVGRYRREALQILTDLRRQGAGSSDDWLLLAELCQSDGQWPRVRREMQALLATAVTPRLIASYLDELLEHGELQEVDRWIRRLEQFEPESQRTLRLRVRMRVMEGNAKEAVQIMNRYVGDAGDPTTRSERLGWVARTSEDMANLNGLTLAAKDLLIASAEVAYRDWAAADPAAAGKRAQFLARRGQIGLALELLEQMADESDANAISISTDVLAGCQELTQPQLLRIRALLDRSIERQGPNDRRGVAELLVSQAGIASLSGDSPSAEAFYRRALGIDPRHVVALSKLALLRSLSDGQHAEALRLVEQAMEIAGPEAQLLDLRATIELAAGQLRKSQSDLQSVMEDRPLASAYFHLAQLLAAQGDAKRALAALEHGQQLGLSLHGLHPLEHQTYQKLVSELKGWTAQHEFSPTMGPAGQGSEAP